jgi:hypothetical protein
LKSSGREWLLRGWPDEWLDMSGRGDPVDIIPWRLVRLQAEGE